MIIFNPQVCIKEMQETWLKIFALIIYHIVTVLFLWSYWQTIFTVSSRVPRKFKIPQGKYPILMVFVLYCSGLQKHIEL